MSVINVESKSLETPTCPLCDARLDANQPNECPRCDWTADSERARIAHPGRDRDFASVLLSVVPGLGHVYKGHPLLGVLFAVGGLLAVVAVSLIATFTMGFGVLLLPLYWVGVMLHVYWLEDRRIPKPVSA